MHCLVGTKQLWLGKFDRGDQHLIYPRPGDTVSLNLIVQASDANTGRRYRHLINWSTFWSIITVQLASLLQVALREEAAWKLLCSYSAPAWKLPAGSLAARKASWLYNNSQIGTNKQSWAAPPRSITRPERKQHNVKQTTQLHVSASCISCLVVCITPCALGALPGCSTCTATKLA